jgi:hypothetical protein
MAKKIQDFAIIQDQSEEIYDLVLQLEEVCLQACSELQEELNLIKNT